MLKRDRAERQLDSSDTNSPCRGDKILHVGPGGEPNNLSSKVQTLVSSDKEDGLYEVTDQFGRSLVIVELREGVWIEVLL